MAPDPFIAAIRRSVLDQEREEKTVFSCDRRQLNAALFIIRAALGDDWGQQRLLHEREDYLANQSGVAGRYKFQDRLVALGELLLNLKQVDGFDHRLKTLQSESVESWMAEMEGARLLMSSGIPFRFVKPSGSLSADYDVLAVIGGSEVACEMKAKLEVTDPSANSVRDTLNRARTQLPASHGGVVFLKVPESWARSPEGREAIRVGLRHSFKSTGRVAAVIVQWEQWRELERGAIRTVLFQFHENRRARQPLPQLSTAIKAWPATLPGRWLALQTLVCEAEDVTRGFAVALAAGPARDVATGRLPFPGGGISYLGSMEIVSQAQGNQMSMAVDFRSAEFALFKNETQRSALVTLDDGPVQIFKVLRGAAPDGFQLQISEASENRGLTTAISETLRRKQSLDDALSGQSQNFDAENMLASDPVLGLLRGIFDGLRSTGDIPTDSCRLHDIVASLFTKADDDAPAFQVRYLGLGVKL